MDDRDGYPFTQMNTGRRTLEDVLGAAQRAGTLGDRPIVEIIEHARHFVRVIPSTAKSVIDIGSGAGVPGLVIAQDRPELSITLVDRRATRMDALKRSVEALQLGHQVRVLTADASDLAKSLEFVNSFDVAVCRGLGPPSYTARLARPFLVKGGILVVSEPPDASGGRWPQSLWAPLGYDGAQLGGSVAILTAG